MNEASIRTEDIDPKEIKNYFVETTNDRECINILKGKQPVLLVGSRGTGKTMLLRMAEQEISEQFATKRHLPVFVNLVTCNMHASKNIIQVLISRTLLALQRSLKTHGIMLTGRIFKPVTDCVANPIVSKLEKYITDTDVQINKSEFEINDESIRNDTAKLLDFLEELCQSFSIKRITFFFDEACQVFQPTQQRIFFDYFRALRNHSIICKAAVYPGIVTYGTFQKFHDATVKRVERSITSENYISKMREILSKHYPDNYQTLISHGEVLDAIIYASSGNPRFLLKSINEILANKFNTNNANAIIKEFYGTTIWSEHIKLGELYSGHRDMINWARNFIEDKVLADINAINANPTSKNTIYFVLSRNAPEVIKQAIKTLEYSGIISLHTEGTKYRTEMYDRYEVNVGVIVLSEKQVTIQKRIPEIVDDLSIKIFPDYGANSGAYGDYSALVNISEYEANYNEIMKYMSCKSIDGLDISPYLLSLLKNCGLKTIGDILDKDESELQKIRYIGPKRSRKISNIVYNSILEYISG